MSIHPWLERKFELIRDIPSFQVAFADPQAGARVAAFLEDPAPWNPPAGVTTAVLSVDGPHGAVPVRVFRPTGPDVDPRPALVWMHGGGFVAGSIDDTESVIPGSELAARAGAVVISVGYHLAVGGVRHPVPVDDVEAVWRWVVADAARLGVDPGRLFLGGASVGGTLATAVAGRLRDAGEPAPRGLLLGYPLLHFPLPPATADRERELAQVPVMLRFPLEYQQGIVANYAGRVDGLTADVAPGNFSVAGLPETWVAPSEYDDLRESGDLFAQQLAATGVPVHVQVARGMVHGHLGRGPSLAPVDANLDFFASALRGDGLG